MIAQHKEVSAFLKQLYALQDESSLIQVIVAGLSRLIGGNNYFVSEHDPVRRIPLNACFKYASSRPDLLLEVCETGAMNDHPIWELVQKSNGRSIAISDIMTPQKWSNHMIYRELLREDYVKDHLSVDIRMSAQHYLTIGVCRDKRGFRDQDRLLLEQLLPHFEQAYANAKAVGNSDLMRRRKQAAVTTFKVSKSGSLVVGEASVAKRLRHLNGAAAKSALRNLDAWLKHQVDKMNRGSLDDLTLPHRVSNHHQIMEFRLHRKWGGHEYLLSQRLVNDAKDRLGTLTVRENEVLHWICEGKTNPEIAIILGLSIFTVKDHLKQIFRKLGVDNRTAAARARGY